MQEGRFWSNLLHTGKVGQPRFFPTPESLGLECFKYFEWCTNNPLMSVEVYGAKQPEMMDIPKMRAFTIYGLVNFLNISLQTWYNYKAKIEYLDVISHVEAIIYQQKFEGAAAGLLNPNIIARDLGLVDKKEVKSEQTRKVILYTPDNGRKIDNLKAPIPISSNSLESKQIEEKGRWDDIEL